MSGQIGVMSVKAFLGMSFVMYNLLLPERVYIRIPTFDVPIFVRFFMSFHRIFMVASCIAELVALWTIESLKEFFTLSLVKPSIEI